MLLRLHDDGWEAALQLKGPCSNPRGAAPPLRGETTTVQPPVEKEVFPKPDEVPRVTRSEIRGGPQAPRPNRFNRRPLSDDDANSGRVSSCLRHGHR